MNKFTRKKGFTLIEVLAVISIIGILAAVVIISLSSSRTKARDSRRKTDLNLIHDAMNLYLADPANRGLYPKLITMTSGNNMGWCGVYGLDTPGVDTIYQINWKNLQATAPGSPPFDTLKPYIENGIIPSDPVGKCTSGAIPGTQANVSGPSDYEISISTDQTRFSVWAALENPNDPDRNGSANKYTGLYFSSNVGNRDWTYGVGTQ